MAPTTERDFDMLPAEKQALYQAVQQVHLHGSPDGPWFFIIARSQPDSQTWQLLGITDTSMLRPQVFALYEGEAGVQVGLIASERQAINAFLRSLSQEDARFQPLADKYWVARGGSYTDGGAFVYTVSKDGDACRLTARNKFGDPITIAKPAQPSGLARGTDWTEELVNLTQGASKFSATEWFTAAKESLTSADLSQVAAWLEWLLAFSSADDDQRRFAIQALTLLRDRRYATGLKKRSALLSKVNEALYCLLRCLPAIDCSSPGSYRRLDVSSRQALRSPQSGEEVLVIDAYGFPPEGEASVARLLCQAYAIGWQRFITFDWRGGRFIGCGLGEGSDGVQLDVYGDSGDYLASGLEGGQIIMHGDAQDQVGQILKRGLLVIHGDVGQTFLYGAKGGEIYIMGSAAGRPLINAVGKPRVVINGTCLDYLAESFMAGDPLNGGGFAILNGVTFTEDGQLVELETPYPGGNLFSLASGGAIYLRDPHGKVGEDQLNGGQFAPLSDADWHLIEPHLRQNEALFGIQVADLLRVDGTSLPPDQVYRKVEVKSLDVLH